MRVLRKKSQLLTIALVVGFFVGIIYENIVAGKQVTTSDLFLKSNLQRYLQMNVITQKYFWYVAKERILFLLVVCICACMKWKKAFVTLLLLAVGILSGALTVSAILQLGIKGLGLCILGLLPQGLFYGVAYYILILYWYQYPEQKWNRVKMIFVLIMYGIGIVMEAYVNPILIKWMIKTIC